MSAAMPRPAGQDTTSSLRRALTLLDVFSTGVHELTLRELAAASGVPRSTTHRLVAELIEWGALERGTRGVRLGVKLFELGVMAPTQSMLREAASPLLRALTEATGLTANLAIRDGSGIVYLEKLSSPTLTVPHSRLGGRGSVHATALGKAMLAFPGYEGVEMITDATLPALTPRTITEPAALAVELAAIRRSGVAFDVEESQLGLFCVAAPIRTGRGRAIAAVSVTGATELSQAERFAPSVVATARRIERRLGDRSFS